MNKPLFEVRCNDSKTHYKIYEDGRIEGFEPGAIIVNRIAPKIAALQASISLSEPQTYGPDMDGEMVASDIDEWVSIDDYRSAASDADKMQQAFNNAINFAIDTCDSYTGGIDFLTLWREGCWPEIREGFPEFVEQYGIPE